MVTCFENLTIKLYILYILNIHKILFQSNVIYYSIHNLFFMDNFILQKLEI